MVAQTSQRFSRGRDVVTARPALLFSDGQPLPDALSNERVTMDEIRQAVRSSGVGGLADVAAVVLETDGSLSVIRTTAMGDGLAMEGVTGAERRGSR